MRAHCFAMAILSIGLSLRGTTAEEGMLIGAPDTRPTAVDSEGRVQEGWGAVGASLVPEGRPIEKAATPKQFREECDAPVVVTETLNGGWRLVVSAYRAPIWPQGVDVLDVVVRNLSCQNRSARLVLNVPKGLSLSGMSLRHGGRVAVALAPPPRAIRSTGCLTGAQAMPRWAKPNAPCDRAFQNIRAGMGGIPITYRFAVGRGAACKAALGFCESHWAEAKQRPLLVDVEGAARKEIDPIAEWGRHVPACLLFDAKDTNADGWVEISVLPKPGAPDRNPILNAIWIFAPDARVDAKEIALGRMNGSAKHYVDVGGESDRPMSEPGKIDPAKAGSGEVGYPIEIEPGKEERLTFLVACSGVSAPVWEESAWTPDSLRAAAEGVWSDWLKTSDRDTSSCRAALAEIMMCRGQADDYFVALPRPGGFDQFSCAASGRIVRALDLAGFPREAERMLRLYWQKPVPKPLEPLAQTEEGEWKDAKGAACPQAQALLALAEHAALTGDGEWSARAYPAMKAGAEWMRKHRAEGGQDAAWSACALEAVASVAKGLGHAEDEAWMRAEAQALGGAPPDEAPAYSGLGPCVDAANTIIAQCRKPSRQ